MKLFAATLLVLSLCIPVAAEDLPSPVVKFTINSVTSTWVNASGQVKQFSNTDSAVDFTRELVANGIPSYTSIPAPNTSSLNQDTEDTVGEPRYETVYVTEYQTVCVNGVCRHIPVRRAVRRLVQTSAAVVGAASTAVVSTVRYPVNYYTNFSTYACPCGCGIAGCNCGAGSAAYGYSTYTYSTYSNAAPLNVSASAVTLANQGLFARWRTNRYLRRVGRMQARINFSNCGVNSRARGLATFFPNAWFSVWR